MVNQVQEEYEAKDERMVKYLQKVKNQLQKFSEWNVTQIIREENVWAYALAGLTASLVVTQTTILPVYYQDDPLVLEKNQVNDIHGSWMEPIIKYLEVGELPKDELQEHWIRIKSAQYSMIEG